MEEVADPAQTRTEAAPERRFAAFISYAHADAAHAARLQRRLETYHLPKGLGARPGDDQTDRIGAVFRDRADLAAATSLSDAIRDALARSAALIVLCSPDAVRSHWVSEEIRLFRALHPARPVLAVIVRGDPAEAMPAALTDGGKEPLAADLRAQGDGRRLGFLKIVAALLGVPLDALIRRDAKRQFRRVIAVTLIGLIALIVMATMTVMAIQARNEAQRQRVAAESLVEFMLTDLRTRLKGVGRTDVMRAVNVEAMDHYRGQGDLSSLPDDSLERRARLLMAMGDDDVRDGDEAAAMQKFTEAHRVTGSLLSRQPDNPERIFAHAQSEYWVGSIHQNRREYDAARRYYAGYRVLAERLIAVDPDRVRALRELGYAQGNLCSLATLQRSPDSIGPCRSSLQAMQRVARMQPDHVESRLAVINRHGWLIDAYVLAGDVPAARASALRSLDLARQLAATDPGNFDYKEVLAGTLITVVQFERRHGPPAPGTAALSAEARQLVRDLRRQDPGNVRWQMLERMTDGLSAPANGAR